MRRRIPSVPEETKSAALAFMYQRLVLHHEIGHAIIGMACGLTLKKVTVEPFSGRVNVIPRMTGDDLIVSLRRSGYSMTTAHRLMQEVSIQMALFALGGPIAETVAGNGRFSPRTEPTWDQDKQCWNGHLESAFPYAKESELATHTRNCARFLKEVMQGPEYCKIFDAFQKHIQRSRDSQLGASALREIRLDYAKEIGAIRERLINPFINGMITQQARREFRFTELLERLGSS